MSFGVKTVSDTGKTLDSTSYAVNLVDVFTVDAASAGTKEYRDFAGFTLNAVLFKSSYTAIASASAVSFTYDLGYPVMSWTQIRGGSANSYIVYVFAV